MRPPSHQPLRRMGRVVEPPDDQLRLRRLGIVRNRGPDKVAEGCPRLKAAGA